MHSEPRREAGREVVGGGRLGLVGAALTEVVDDLASQAVEGADGVTAGSGGAAATTGLPVRVLDCGGGTGTIAVPLARYGAHVTVVDISADALATLTRRAAEVGVAERIRPVAGDVESLASAVAAAGADEAFGGATFDLVLAHGVLDAVDDVAAVLAQMAAMVRPGGVLSVLVGNPVAAVLSRALAGELVAAVREFGRLDAAPSAVGGPDGSSGAGPEVVQRWCVEHGLTVEQVQGIGVFTDLVPGAALDQPGARLALAELEAACARRRPFAEIAGRVHLLARRPG